MRLILILNQDLFQLIHKKLDLPLLMNLKFPTLFQKLLRPQINLTQKKIHKKSHNKNHPQKLLLTLLLTKLKPFLKHMKLKIKLINTMTQIQKQFMPL